ncbi:FCD domain-containing protein [Nocardia sp. ET3-3]|uniref:FCD domain-containing protein n=1 Tax=Nocardia terrae TaxID=2675851 RepID=A0A7K1UVF0_9NOCA|nr:FCD domain-containing protein [Nocardia terrae]MVU78251.1 FCD domain-containing protein [Nocardia terrae]
MTKPSSGTSRLLGSRYSGRGTHGYAVEWLATRIFDGTFPESEAIDLPAATAELDVSQTVVREALKVLTAKGLVAAKQKRGTVVRPREQWNLLDADVLRWQLGAGVTDGFYTELRALRRAIEPASAALAAEHRTDEDLAALDAALAAMTAAGTEVMPLVKADADFHTALLDASHNRFFGQLHHLIIPGLIQRDMHVHSGEFDDSVPLHAAVAEAVRARDPEAARRAVNFLLDMAARDDALANLPEPELSQQLRPEDRP